MDYSNAVMFVKDGKLRKRASKGLLASIIDASRAKHWLPPSVVIGNCTKQSQVQALCEARDQNADDECQNIHC